MEKIEEMNRKNKCITLDSASFVPSTLEDKKPIRKLYINNFKGKINRKALQKTFSVYGKVIECRGPFYNFRGYPFSFITYLDPADAAKALEAGSRKEVLFNGSPLRLMASFPHTQPSENHIEQLSKKQKMSNKSPKKNQEENKNEKEKENEKDEDGVDYINKLDDDCLINIFTMLTIRERIRIERVCKRWQDVSARAWHDIKELDLMNQIQISNGEVQKIKNRAFEKILERCGRFLTTLHFSTVNLGCNSEIMPVIGEHCQNITRLILQLRKYPSKELFKLLSSIKKLQYFEMKDIGKHFKSDCLANLSHQMLEEIHLSTKMSYESFEPHLRYLGRPKSGMFQHLENLRSLTLCGFILRPDNLKVLAEKPHLTYLSLVNCSVKKNIIKLTALQKLEHLNLSKVLEVSNALLVSLAENCTQLKYLNISDCTSVDDSGVAALAKLPQLEVLLINDIYDVKDATLSKFVAIHELHCESCEQVRDEGIIKLIETAPNLKYLNLFNTTVSSALIDVADAVTRTRTNNLKLHIKMSSAALENWAGIADCSPLLEIESKDDTVTDMSDDMLYDDEVDDAFWDVGIDENDDYDDDEYDFDEFDYNGENPFYII